MIRLMEWKRFSEERPFDRQYVLVFEDKDLVYNCCFPKCSKCKEKDENGCDKCQLKPRYSIFYYREVEQFQCFYPQNCPHTNYWREQIEYWAPLPPPLVWPVPKYEDE